MGSQAIIYVLIFIGVVLIVEGIYLVMFGKSIKLNSRVNRRLAGEPGNGYWAMSSDFLFSLRDRCWLQRWRPIRFLRHVLQV